MKNASTIAKAFLKLSQPSVGDTISNLKLQKLLYYAQGFFLAIYDRPLFKEDIVSWDHGPVVREVYDEYSIFVSDVIPVPDGEVKLSKREGELIANVWKVYGQFSAWKLRDMTHKEMPWLTTGKNHVISHEKLSRFFKTLVVNEK